MCLYYNRINTDFNTFNKLMSINTNLGLKSIYNNNKNIICFKWEKIIYLLESRKWEKILKWSIVRRKILNKILEIISNKTIISVSVNGLKLPIKRLSN